MAAVADPISVAQPPAGRDAGLVRGIGVGGLAANVANYMVGAGIFVIPATVAAAVGTAAPLVFVAAALVMGAITICFAEASSRAPSSGGAYGFVEAAFGPFWGFLAGAMAWASVVLASGGVAAAAADVAAAFDPALGSPLVRAALIVGWFAILAGVNILGVRGATGVVKVSATIKLVPLAIFLGVGVTLVDLDAFTVPAAIAPGGYAQAAILALFLFTGMEGALTVSGEVRDPARSIPRALALALVGVSAMFIAVQLVAEGALGPALGASSTPLADVMGLVSPGLRALLLAGAAISMMGWLASDMLSSPRTLFAFARDGILPAALGRLHARTRAPRAAILVHGAIAAGLAVSGGFTKLAVLSTLVVVGVYVLGCAAAVALRRRGLALAGPPVVIPGMPVAALVALAAMAWLTTQATAAEAAAVGLLLLVLGALYWLARRRRI